MRRILLLILVLSTAALAQEKRAPIANTPEFAKLKLLVGEWEGTATDMGQTFPVTASVRMSSDGSVIMHTLGPGTPVEMVSMIHPDGKSVMMTHYCAAHNQPRMKATSLQGDTVTFRFLDITNLENESDGHMDGVAFIIPDADHHTEEWSYVDKGKRTTGQFVFTRKK